MDAYDPLDAPDPDEWLPLNDHERLMLVIDHHRQAGVDSAGMPRMRSA